MRKIDLPKRRERLALAGPYRLRRTLADSVNAQDGGFGERAEVESGSGMRLMMLGEQELRQRLLLAAADARELLPEHVLEAQLFLEPDRHRHRERPDALRRICEIRLEQTLEFHQRLVVENDRIELIDFQPPLLQTVLDRGAREAGIVLLSREALLLSRRAR